MPHFQKNYRQEGQWFSSVQTLALTRASQKPRAYLKERQKQITVVPETRDSQAQPQMYMAPPFPPDLWSVISICALGGKAIGVREYQLLFVFPSVRTQHKAEGGMQRMKGVIYLACTLILRVWAIALSPDYSSSPYPVLTTAPIFFLYCPLRLVKNPLGKESLNHCTIFRASLNPGSIIYERLLWVGQFYCWTLNNKTS